jgi:hypothetical protein
METWVFPYREGWHSFVVWEGSHHNGISLRRAELYAVR